MIENRRNANWARRYELNHKAHELGLGSAFTFTLAEAREHNRAISKQLADGIDPLALKRQQRAARAAAAARVLTFKEVVEGYLTAHQSKWRSADHGQQWIRSLRRYVYPVIGALDVNAVGVPEVLRTLEQRVPAALGYPAGEFWTARSVSADRVRNRIELVLDGPLAAVIGAAITRRPGASSNTFCRNRRRWRGSTTTPPCPTPRCRP